MPDIPFAGYLPAPVHRAVLRVAEAVRRAWWSLRKPTLRGCAIVVFDSRERVLLVRHSYRKQDEWHVPTGGVSKDEEILLAARRELAEEVGMSVPVLSVVHEEWVPIGGARNWATVLTGTSEDQPRADLREIAEARFFAIDALPEMTPPWARRYVALARDARG